MVKLNVNLYFKYGGDYIHNPYCVAFHRTNPLEDYKITQDELENIFGKEYLAWLEEVGDGCFDGIEEEPMEVMCLNITKDETGNVTKKWTRKLRNPTH